MKWYNWLYIGLIVVTGVLAILLILMAKGG